MFMECVIGARPHAKGLNWIISFNLQVNGGSGPCVEREKQSGQDHRAYIQGLGLAASSRAPPGHTALTSDTCLWK